MGWLGKIFGAGSIVEKAVAIGAKAVVNKDKLIEFAAKSDEGKKDMYLAELQTRTIPIIDAFHKMGRQIFQYMTLYFVWQSSKHGWSVDSNAWLVLGTLGGVYSLMKGKGK